MSAVEEAAVARAIKASDGDARAYIEQIDRLRRCMLIELGSNPRVPPWLRDMVCKTINYGVNRIIAWVYDDQRRAEDAMRQRKIAA